MISRFFEGIGEAKIYQAMKDMVRYLNLLVLPGREKRGIVLRILKISGHYESKHGLIINYEKNPACADSTEKLIRLYQKAAELAVELIDGFPAVVRGEAELPEIFRRSSGIILARGCRGRRKFTTRTEMVKFSRRRGSGSGVAPGKGA